MNTQKLLKNLIFFMCLFGAGAIATVLWQSSQTLEQPRESLLTFNLADLSPDSFSIQDCECESKAKILVLWQGEDRISALLLKMRDGQFVLAGKSERLCGNLAPQAVGLGRLKTDGYILCQDADLTDNTIWKWRLDGVALNPDVADLPQLSVERKGTQLHIYR